MRFYDSTLAEFMDSPGHTFGGALARSRAFPFHSASRCLFEADHEAVASLGTRAARSALASGTGIRACEYKRWNLPLAAP